VAAAIAGSSGASAQSAGSFSAAVSNVAIIPTIVCAAPNTSPIDPLNCKNTASQFLQLEIKVSNGNSSLLVGGSLETAILTNTSTTGGGGKQQMATATGSVVVTMLVDGQSAPVGCMSSCPIGLAYPPTVTFDERMQSLTTNLGSICSTANGVTTCTSPESIQLILSTTSAHSFNFIVPLLAGGTHTIQFMITASTKATASDALLAGSQATVAVGIGSLTAQVVKTLTPFDSITVGPGGNSQTFSF
jgi:hypothetical protein